VIERIEGVFDMRIIGVVGKNGSGKDEILKYLRTKYAIPFLSTGDIVREMAREKGVEPTRENLKVISEQCFRDMGKGCFVKLVVERIRCHGYQISGISGIRSSDDVKILKDMLGHEFILVSVTVSDTHKRYHRMLNRGEERDPQSYDQFMKQDRDEEALFHIQDAERQADYCINNDGTLSDMHNAIEKLVRDNRLLGGDFHLTAP
jgi:dephospho-CoA kinase